MIRTASAIILCATVVAATEVHAQARAYQLGGYRGLPYFSGGARLGGGFFTDSDTNDLYEGLFYSGVDFKLHFFHWPLAVQTSFDFAGGDGDNPEDLDLGFVADDVDLFLFNWRTSVLLEPPPTYLGDRHFYVQPYIGGGIGVHYVEEELDVVGPFFVASETESRSAFGFHGIAGIDFVFASHVSFGVEAMYSDANMDTPITDLELGGFAISATFKLHF